MKVLENNGTHITDLELFTWVDDFHKERESEQKERLSERCLIKYIFTLIISKL